MTNDKIVTQLKSELAAAHAATADCPDRYATPEEFRAHVDGYWEGRINGLRSALLLLGAGRDETLRPPPPPAPPGAPWTMNGKRPRRRAGRDETLRP